ncbi:hypothetical protein BJF89_13835 [Corynebacterium sp. CNJ-954]|uniref:hypothetical protein n=1 Tax=Corynebacterium sp. CNJ-954 TaxID=1904962 RepID=UPI000968CAA0|nr:hypothetical protein [Corynebacterium sp. CNJ-954]OLT55863.1 hypothetical protein BJF89_13835 [Corynebacterium sp. CNJ-954]
MTSEKELRKIAAEEVTRAVFHHTPLWEDYPELTEDEWVRVVDLISDWPIPDLPEPDNTYPEWEVGDLSISPSVTNGSVFLEWEEPYVHANGTRFRTLKLTPAQVQAIIAAHYHREDQE